MLQKLASSGHFSYVFLLAMWLITEGFEYSKGVSKEKPKKENNGLDRYNCCLSEMDEDNRHSGNGYWVSFGSPPMNRNRYRLLEMSSSSSEESQDADYSYNLLPYLGSDIERLILARFPLSELWKLCLLNKQYLDFVKSGCLFMVRRDIGFKEPSVFMLPSGESCWWVFDGEFKSRRKLPIIPTDMCFTSGDKECFCAGTHLLVSGREIEGLVVWRYELARNTWFKDSPMINPRCLFASATCGTYAYVAGGIVIGLSAKPEVYDTAERYNPRSRTWDALPRMTRKRKLCSGFYMDNKFWVIGGRNDEGELTCGEFFDKAKNRWELIPEMLKDDPVLTCHSPPLVAVVNNELYSLEASSNKLKVYLKRSNTWRLLGGVPVRADFNKGWGVAFKSLGNDLLVMGASSVGVAGNSMAIYTCCPHPDATELQWRPVDCGRNRLSHFILNCSVMPFFSF